MIADVPLINRDAICFGERLRFFIIAGIIGGNGHPHLFQRKADRLANAARTTGYDCDSCHMPSPYFGAA